MKKTLSLILFITLMIYVFTIAAGAAGSGSAVLSASTAAAQPGDTFTVTLSITSNPGIFAMSFTPSYDKSRLQMVSITGSDGNWTCAEGAVWMNSALADDTFTGSAVTMVFKVKDDAAIGTVGIGGSIYAGNYNEEEIPFSLSSTSVTIKSAPHDHDWGTGTVTKEPTCEENGIRIFTCSICNETRDEVIPATGHSWNSGTVTKEPTCKEVGIKTFTCSVCNGTKTEDIAKKPHSYAWVVTKNATCTENGAKEEKCSACGDIRSTQVIPATGHSWNSGTVTKEPTCEEVGIKTFTCSACNGTKTEDIAALGHKWGKWAPVKDQNLHRRVCENCQSFEEAAHAWDKGKETNPASCSQSGELLFTCSICEATKTQVIPATGAHEYTDHYEFTEGEDVHYGFCACGQKGPAENHQYTQEGNVLEKPTTTKEGKQEKLCVCGAKIVVTLDKIPAEYDDVPKTGDITGRIVLLEVLCFTGLVGTLCLLKRRILR